MKAGQNKQARTVQAKQATQNDGRELPRVCAVSQACMDNQNAANRERGDKSCNKRDPPHRNRRGGERTPESQAHTHYRQPRGQRELRRQLGEGAPHHRQAGEWGAQERKHQQKRGQRGWVRKGRQMKWGWGKEGRRGAQGGTRGPTPTQEYRT